MSLAGERVNRRLKVLLKPLQVLDVSVYLAHFFAQTFLNLRATELAGRHLRNDQADLSKREAQGLCVAYEPYAADVSFRVAAVAVLCPLWLIQEPQLFVVPQRVCGGTGCLGQRADVHWRNPQKEKRLDIGAYTKV